MPAATHLRPPPLEAGIHLAALGVPASPPEAPPPCLAATSALPAVIASMTDFRQVSCQSLAGANQMMVLEARTGIGLSFALQQRQDLEGTNLTCA
jgi:hypothetical protein